MIQVGINCGFIRECLNKLDLWIKWGGNWVKVSYVEAFEELPGVMPEVLPEMLPKVLRYYLRCYLRWHFRGRQIVGLRILVTSGEDL